MTEKSTTWYALVRSGKVVAVDRFCSHPEPGDFELSGDKEDVSRHGTILKVDFDAMHEHWIKVMPVLRKREGAGGYEIGHWSSSLRRIGLHGKAVCEWTEHGMTPEWALAKAIARVKGLITS